MSNYISLKNNFVVIVFCCFFFLAGSEFTRAQESSPSPTPESEELKKLKERNQILEEQKKAAEAEKAIAEANKAKEAAEAPPKPTATPLEGKTELEGVKIESEMMAYRALSSVADKVADDVHNKSGEKRIAILNNQWLNGMRGYWATTDQLRLLQKSYDDIFEPLTLPKNEFALSQGFVLRIYGSANQWISGAIDEQMAISSAVRDRKFIFPETFSAITSNFGMIGSAVGAAIDLMAYLRTDTKITGSTFTVQESAFVSQVYRGLNTRANNRTLFYPAEFSPNLNLQKHFVILEKLQKVGEIKAKAEMLVTDIEETDKVLKEAVKTKDSLETRQKQLPGEIKAVKDKLEAYKDSFPNPKKRTREVISDIADLNAKLTALQKEADELSKNIEKNNKAIENLKNELAKLYAEIRPVAPSSQVIEGFIKLGESLDITAYKILGRHFTFEEVEGLSENNEDVKKRLIDEAKKRHSQNYSLALEKELLNPYDSKRLQTFVKLGRHIKSNPVPPDQIELNAVLSNDEQLGLIYPQDEQVKRLVNIINRNKSNSVNRLKILNKQFDKFFEELVKVDATLGLNAISSHLQTENLMDALGCKILSGHCDDAYVLALKVVDVGGNNRVKKNLVTMVATGADITHSGGAIVEYKLYDMNGQIKTSSICRAYEAYRKPKNINRASSSNQNNAVCEILVSETPSNGGERTP
ncbi:hypothetical protein BH24ACI1_BH24ACI1_18020 [soil metagenome]